MFWQYLLVFIATFLTDVIPFPLPPAFVFMVFLQITFKLNIWWVIIIGVIGSIIGRTILTLYIPKISSQIFKPSKNEDVQFLGAKMKSKGWKSQAFILAYSLLPLPTTPLFIAGGMAKMKPYYIIPMFIVGKFTSDMTAVLMGKFAAENTEKLIHGMLSWKSITGLALGFILIFALLFVDWRTLIQKKKFMLKFKIWK
ncbi:MAG: hypothetical protein JWN78_661 [Bacteroidota bacterium]|nr:hypothetical protein [Bacteroidota bacterium]